MASSLDQSKHRQDANGKEIKLHISPTPLLEETKHYLDVPPIYGRGDHKGRPGHIAQPAINIDQYPTLALPLVSIDQFPTQVNLKSVPKPPLSPYSLLDGLTIYEQPTWVIPVIPGTGRAPKTESQASASEGFVSVIRTLLKSSGIYALASLASPLVSLVLAPFLTHTLSQSSYGALAVLTTVIALVAGVTQLGLNAAFLIAYNYDYESQRDRLDVLSTLVTVLLLVTVPTVIVAIAAAPWLAVLLLNSSTFSDSVRIAALVVLVQNLSLPGLFWLHAENRAALFSTLSITNLLVTAAANIVLVGALHMGIAGSLIGTGAGYTIVAACTLPIILSRAGLRLRFTIAWSMLTFGFPHVINLLSGWILQLSDRYLLSHYGTLSQTASYTVAYTLGSVLSSVIIAPFSLAWWTLMYSFAKRDDAKYIFQLIFRWFSIVLLFATFGLSLLGIIVLNILFPPAYHATALIIPIIATSTMFNGIFVVVSLGFSLQRKTWLATIFITFSALLNLGLNIVLIPSYGAMGAAVSTLIAYAALALITYCVNQRIYPVPFEIGLFAIALFIGIALYLGSDFLVQAQEIYVVWGVYTGILLLYGGILLLLGKLPMWKARDTS